MSGTPKHIKDAIRKAYKLRRQSDELEQMIRVYLDEIGCGVGAGAGEAYVLDTYIDVVELGQGEPENVIEQIDLWVRERGQ